MTLIFRTIIHRLSQMEIKKNNRANLTNHNVKSYSTTIPFFIMNSKNEM